MSSISDESTLRDDSSAYCMSDTTTISGGSIHNHLARKGWGGYDEKRDDPIMEEAPAMSPKTYLRRTFITTKAAQAICIMDQRLDDPATLRDYIMSCNTTLDPEMTIRILGSHTYHERSGHDGSTTEVQIDFRIHMPLSLEDPVCRVTTGGEDRIHRRNRRTTFVAASDESCPTLEQWCSRFCTSRAPLRVLRVETSISGLDREYLKNELCRQIRRTGYCGDIDITFPVIGGALSIDIYNAGCINRLRQTILWRWILAVLFWWLPIWWGVIIPLFIYTTQYWDVCVLQWQVELTSQGEPCDEYAWLTQHSDLIKTLVSSRFFGNAGHLCKYAVVKDPSVRRKADSVFVDGTKGERFSPDAKPSEWGHNGVQTYDRYT